MERPASAKRKREGRSRRSEGTRNGGNCWGEKTATASEEKWKRGNKQDWSEKKSLLPGACLMDCQMRQQTRLGLPEKLIARKKWQQKRQGYVIASARIARMLRRRDKACIQPVSAWEIVGGEDRVQASHCNLQGEFLMSIMMVLQALMVPTSILMVLEAPQLLSSVLAWSPDPLECRPSIRIDGCNHWGT